MHAASSSSSPPVNTYIWDHLGQDLSRPMLWQSRNGSVYAAVARCVEYFKNISVTELTGQNPNIVFNHMGWQFLVMLAYPDNRGWTAHDVFVLIQNEERREHEEENVGERVGLLVDKSGMTHWVDHVLGICQPTVEQITHYLEFLKMPLVASIYVCTNYPYFAEAPYTYDPKALEEVLKYRNNPAHVVVLVGVHRPTRQNNPYRLDLDRSYFIYQTSFCQMSYNEQRRSNANTTSMLPNGMGVIDSGLIHQIDFSISCPDPAIMQVSELTYEATGRLRELHFLRTASENALWLLNGGVGELKTSNNDIFCCKAAVALVIEEIHPFEDTAAFCLIQPASVARFDSYIRQQQFKI